MMNQNSSNLSFPLKAHPGPHIPSSDRSDSPRMASQPPQQSPYVVLSIARSATAEEVRKAYRQKVLETHPDKLPQTATELQKELATERFHRVQAAFEILNNVETRRAYDIHVRPLPDYVPKKWDEDQVRRTKERNEWAKQSEQRQQDRMKLFKETAEEQLHNIQQCTTTVQKNTMVDKMLQELYALNPEWEARRQKAQAYKYTRSQTMA